MLISNSYCLLVYFFFWQVFQTGERNQWNNWLPSLCLLRHVIFILINNLSYQYNFFWKQIFHLWKFSSMVTILLLAIQYCSFITSILHVCICMAPQHEFTWTTFHVAWNMSRLLCATHVTWYFSRGTHETWHTPRHVEPDPCEQLVTRVNIPCNLHTWRHVHWWHCYLANSCITSSNNLLNVSNFTKC